MELLRSAIAQAMLTKKPIPDVPLLTLVRESLIEQIRVRFPETTGTVSTEPIQANCFGVVDFRAWLDCIPQRYRNIKIDKWIRQEENLLVYTGRFLVEKEVVRFPLEPPNEQKMPIGDYYWELSPYVRDHRELKDSDVYICKLIKRGNNGERTTKCAFEIFIIQPNAVKKMVQIAQREIRKSITGAGGQNPDEKPKVREYNVRWIAPGLEVVSKVTELYGYMQRQQLYLSSELEKRIRRLEDVRLEILAVSPDQPSPEIRLTGSAEPVFH
ncbi:uncharacterized protein LOC129581805 isoform X2 [Paramacrobiotus metropolitanus]|uniref:uncharacterized protein LOC129581805 isoform X2 n=1 Tax=Paramacrobiotus metropolitanus TaxID=2943436 RepID=UPI002445FC11|nr:uncharacterized protein LOC129581805 isoform X2 [Paramacrobiotus metropolitanus]